MDKILMIKLIFGSLLTFSAFILLFITFKYWYKYIIQESKCDKTIKGHVKGYTTTQKGPSGSGVHLPIVHYIVDNKDYSVVGPEYSVIYLINKTTSSSNNMEFEEIDQKLIINKKSNFILNISNNPMERLYPLNSAVDVFYYSKNPQIAYVRRYCNKKYAFWIGLICAISILVIDLLILIIL